MKALICGTSPSSIGRYAGEYLATKGWDIWLYSRTVVASDQGRIHIRPMDLVDPTSTYSLLQEIGEVDLVIMSADTGTAFGSFEELSESEIAGFLDAKVSGSIFLIQQLIRRGLSSRIVWLCGKPGTKGATYFLYGPTNSFILSLVEGINRLFPKLRAYYLETPVITSPVGEAYRKRVGDFPKDWEVYNSESMLPRINQIIQGKVPPGLVSFSGEAK